MTKGKSKTLCKALGCALRRYGSLRLCRSHYYERKTLQARIKAKSKKPTKKKTEKERKTLHKKCWKLMSELVRRKDSDSWGNVRCFTCPAILHWKEMNAGHWKHGSLDFDERNIRLQCPRCNLYLSGRLEEYTMRLVKENGIEWVERLANDASRHLGYRLEDLKKIHDDLLVRVSSLGNI